MLPNFTYQIEDNNTVKIYDGINDDGPLIIQPNHPDGSAFTAETAQAWAEQFIIDWHANYEETQRVVALKESIKNKLATGQPLTEEEAAIIIL
jgi:hypothetical protein